MECVSPIKEISQIQAIKERLCQQSARDYLLFVFGINTGIRVHDLLSLKVSDVYNRGEIKEFLAVDDERSESPKMHYLNQQVRTALEAYLKQGRLHDGDFLFKSKKNNLPITRQQAYRIINGAAKEAGVTEKIGMHTLRKTFGYHAYKKGIAISILMNIYNHHSPAETLRYLGIDKNEEKYIKVDVNL
ncbi:tyrosine-type recombinase/integrase [Bacillus rubiinfantis]|uniref:tyrosine-type recombinase/integrase n=1 Tax=Bacillus rubiinfantis TaxID=1499680 RepID=UPI0005A64A91|nr:tyrosine-type recombinase/integrase [Bacillus rubiinfantis]